MGKINVENLRAATPAVKEDSGVKTVRASDLVKVGGLYRIRDNYEAVWRLDAGEDGRRYITRSDTGDGAPERLAVTEDGPTADSSKAAFKVIRAGAVYVAWECEACATPNLTKFGNSYECDECHKKYADVLKAQEEKKTYTRAEVAEHSPDFAKRMAQAGINVAHVSLLRVWEKEAEGMPTLPQCKHCSGSGNAHEKDCPNRKSGAKAVNPWAVCHESVGPEKSEKFERCVKDVKKKSPIKKD